MADGLRVEQAGLQTWPHILALVDDVVTVTEEEIGAAVAWVAREGRVDGYGVPHPWQHRLDASRLAHRAVERQGEPIRRDCNA